jgi:ribosomal protein S18 acetylase RimI-like enzyme
MAVRIELLGDHAGRDGFTCGVAALDEFLARRAGQQQRKGFGTTYVALAGPDDAIAGFVTVSAGQITTAGLPAATKLPHHPAPILRIGRLAVDQRFQGLGIGHALLAFALRLALEFSERVGLHAVVVDAKNEKAAAFYRRLGFRPTLDNALCLYLSLVVLRQTTSVNVR